MDFTTPTEIGARIDDNYDQLCWATATTTTTSSTAKAPVSSWRREFTNRQPDVFWKSRPRSRECSSTRQLPGWHGDRKKATSTSAVTDSASKPSTSRIRRIIRISRRTILKPGETFKSKTVFKFSTK